MIDRGKIWHTEIKFNEKHGFILAYATVIFLLRVRINFHPILYVF